MNKGAAILALISLLATTAYAADDSVEAAKTLVSPKVPKPNRLYKYYTAWPVPIPVRKYTKALFTCKGRYALCSYATCVIIPNSVPPVADSRSG